MDPKERMMKGTKLSEREDSEWLITVPFDLLFDWFGLVCFANKNKNCELSYS